MSPTGFLSSGGNLEPDTMSDFIPANLPGEMARRVREMDWSKTSLGASENWPQSLKLAVAVMLASGFPMAIRWGADLVVIYNDAYRPILGDRHPGALGRPLREVWPEIYPELGPLNEAILRGEHGAFFGVDHPWADSSPGIEPRRPALYGQLQPDPGRDRSQRHRRHSGHLHRDDRARPQGRGAALLNNRLEAEIAATGARTRPHLAGVRGPPRRVQL